jgi:hypothetical protein
VSAEPPCDGLFLSFSSTSCNSCPMSSGLVKYALAPAARRWLASTCIGQRGHFHGADHTLRYRQRQPVAPVVLAEHDELGHFAQSGGLAISQICGRSHSPSGLFSPSASASHRTRILESKVRHRQSEQKRTRQLRKQRGHRRCQPPQFLLGLNTS